MTWLAIINSVKSCYAWLRENWKIPFLLVWTLIVFFFSRKNTAATEDVLETKKKSHDAQIKSLKEKHLDEILKRDNLIEKYKKTLENIESSFKEKERTISELEKEKIKEIVANSKGDADEVKRQIKEMFNFTHIN